MPRAIIEDFTDLITEYSSDFVGRGWLSERLDRLLAEPGCRVVVLTGGPGVGKTAFLADLARRHRDWPRYFIRRNSSEFLRPGDARTFLLATGGQLAAVRPNLYGPEDLCAVVRGEIETVAPGGEAVGIEIDELRASPFVKVAFQVELKVKRLEGRALGLKIGRMIADNRQFSLQDLQYLGFVYPLRLLSRTDPSARVVVLVDALDELRYSPTEGEPDLLRAIREMPDLVSMANLRFVVASRPEPGLLKELLALSHVRHLPLDVLEKENLSELRSYAEAAIHELEGLRAFDGTGSDKATFTGAVLEKASGNFLYLKSVLGAVRDAAASKVKRGSLPDLLKIEDLPGGDLPQLYGRFLQYAERWCKGEFPEQTWRRYLGPLLGVLAVAREALSEAELARFTTLDTTDVRLLLREVTQVVQTGGTPTRSRIVHSSFAQFLTDPTVNEFHRLDEDKCHDMISRYYRGEFEGRWHRCDRYGLDHLAAHTAGGTAPGRLFDLLTADWMYARVAQTGSYLGFASDLAFADSLVGAEVTPETVLRVVRVVTLGLVAREGVTTFEDLDLMTLVQLGRVDEARDHALLRGNDAERLKGLLAVHRACASNGKPSPVGIEQLLSLASRISDLHSQATFLGEVAEAYSAVQRDTAMETFEDARRAAGAIEDDQRRWWTLQRLVEGMTRNGFLDRAAELLEEFGRDLRSRLSMDPMARSLGGSSAWTSAALTLATRLASEGQLDRAERVVRAMDDRDALAAGLSMIAASLAKSSVKRALGIAQEARHIATQYEYISDRSLAAVAAALRASCDDGAEETLRLALEKARRNPEEADRAVALSRVGRIYAEVDPRSAARLFNEAEAITNRKDFVHGRDGALGRMVDDHCGLGDYQRALVLAMRVTDEAKRAELLHTIGVTADSGSATIKDLVKAAEACFASTPSSELRLRVGRHVAFILSKYGAEQAVETFKATQVLARDSRRPGFQWALDEWVPALAHSGSHAVAVKLAVLNGEPAVRTRRLIGIVAWLLSREQYEEAVSAAAHLDEDAAGLKALISLGAALFEARHVEAESVMARVAESLAELTPPWKRAMLSARYAAVLLRTDEVRARGLFDRLAEEVCEIEPPPPLSHGQ